MIGNLRDAVMEVYGGRELSSWLMSACRSVEIDRAATRSLWTRALDANVEALNLYIHVPWCRSRCRYCMYPSEVVRGTDEIDEYTRSLKSEMKGIADVFSGHGFSDFYIGGGTVTVLPPDRLDSVLGCAFDLFDVGAGGERTMEANPESCTEKHLDVAFNRGVNRLSFGVQTFDRGLLDAYGRPPVERDRLRRLIESARRFDSVNLDLLVGLKGQDLRTFKADLDLVLEYAPDEIHCYRYQPGNRESPGPLDYWEASRLIREERPGGYEVSVNGFVITLRRPGHHEFGSGYSLYDYPGRSTLGFGRWAISRIVGVGEYHCDGTSFTLLEYPPEFEKFRFMVDCLERRGGIDAREYEARFDEPLAVRFSREIRDVEREGTASMSCHELVPAGRDTVASLLATLLPPSYLVTMLSGTDTDWIPVVGNDCFERLLTPLLRGGGGSPSGYRAIAVRLVGGIAEIEVGDVSRDSRSLVLLIGRRGVVGKALVSSGEFDVWYRSEAPSNDARDLCGAVAKRLHRHGYESFWRYLVTGASYGGRAGSTRQD